MRKGSNGRYDDSPRAKSRRRRVKAYNRRSLCLLLPSLCGFLAFFVVPFIYSFTYAFEKNAFTHEFVGLDNLRALLGNSHFRLAMRNTLSFVAVSVPLTMVLSIAAALLIAQVASRLPMLKSAFFLPVVLPSATVVMLCGAYLTKLPPFSSLLLLYLWKYGGLHLMLILTAITALPREMGEAALIDGANGWQRARHVTLPCIMPTVFFTLVLAIVNAMKIYRESFLLYGNYPADEVYMLQNYLSNHFAKLNYQNISTAAIFFAVIMYAVVSVIFIVERKWSESIW